MTIIVYGIEGCQWCKKAEVLLERTKIPFVYEHVGDDEKVEFLDEFVNVYGGDRTFPRILKHNEGFVFPKSTLIGGFTELLEEVLRSRI